MAEPGGQPAKHNLSSKKAPKPGHKVGLMLTLVPKERCMSSYRVHSQGCKAGSPCKTHCSSPKSLSSCLRETNLWLRQS